MPEKGQAEGGANTDAAAAAAAAAAAGLRLQQETQGLQELQGMQERERERGPELEPEHRSEGVGSGGLQLPTAASQSFASRDFGGECESTKAEAEVKESFVDAVGNSGLEEPHSEDARHSNLNQDEEAIIERQELETHACRQGEPAAADTDAT